MLHVNGSFGEGGGQILRTALALAVCTQQPFHITGIRAARRKPGLQPQHLAAVEAASTISHARVTGAEQGSQQLRFTPQRVRPGHYHFAVGTAGSTMLVLQTIIPALALADAPSTVILEGGTHNPLAPPFPFIKHCFLPLINRMGPRIAIKLERPGFAPRGGGKVRCTIEPAALLQPLCLTERGRVQRQHAEVLIANLPEHIARRELALIRERLSYTQSQLQMDICNTAAGPGNIVSIMLTSEQLTECFSSFGRRGVAAEQVAMEAVRQVQDYLRAGVAVGPYLADQLLLPMALAGNSEFVTMQPSLHVTTNMAVINKFTQTAFASSETGPGTWHIHID